VALCFGIIARQLCADESVDDADSMFRHPPCSICPRGQEPLLGDFVMPANTAGILPFAMTCDQAQAMANSGSFSPATCLLLRSRIYDTCVCVIVATVGTLLQYEAMLIVKALYH
jgi:hypothetical protein